MIDFERHTIRLVHINSRKEKHGEEKRKMLDLKFAVDLPNVELDRLSPGLRPSLYRAADDAPDLLGKDDQYLPSLRHPNLSTLRWTGEVSPVKMILHLGSRARDDLLLTSAKLNKITINALEGGTFTYGFRLQLEPQDNAATKLLDVLDVDVPATLDLSEAGAAADDEGEA